MCTNKSRNAATSKMATMADVAAELATLGYSEVPAERIFTVGSQGRLEARIAFYDMHFAGMSPRLREVALTGRI